MVSIPADTITTVKYLPTVIRSDGLIPKADNYFLGH
jgi:hypothetical protein